MEKIGFFTPVQHHPCENNRLIDGVEDYFFLKGKKCVVLSGYKLKEVEGKKKIFVTALKILSYFTLIVPFFMLIAKALIRYKHRYLITKETSCLYNALYVLKGIKPALVGENHELQGILASFQKHHPKLKFEKERNFGYLVNEKPLEDFDPRHFVDLSKYKSITEAVMEKFPKQFRLETDQYLSYLLGFGPTWEAYAKGAGVRYMKKPREELSPFFKDRHYFQLGKALGDVDGLQAGKNYCLSIRNERYVIRDPTEEEKQIAALYMEQIIDSVSIKTDYIQKGIKMRKEILEL